MRDTNSMDYFRVRAAESLSSIRPSVRPSNITAKRLSLQPRIACYLYEVRVKRKWYCDQHVSRLASKQRINFL